MLNIILDFERLKYPNTGLYTFCESLGHAVIRNKPINQDIGFYLPKKEFNVFGKEQKYYPQHSFHKFIKPSFPGLDVWHSTNQVSNYFPALKKAKIILTIHDLNFLIEKKENTGKITRLLKKIQKNIDKASIITVISEYVKNDVENHFDLRGKEIKVIYNGGGNVGDLVSAQQPLDFNGRPFLFTIGTVLPKKNFHVLMPLLLNNDFDLVIAGNISSKEYEGKIIEEAKKYGVYNRLKIVGPVSLSTKAWYYKYCTAFLFPSIAEGFGLPVIEALSVGKPVFSSNHTSLPEVGGDVTYYFDSFNPDEMNSVFKIGLEDFNKNNLSQICINHSKKFSWDNTAKQYLDLYQQLA